MTELSIISMPPHPTIHDNNIMPLEVRIPLVANPDASMPNGSLEIPRFEPTFGDSGDEEQGAPTTARMRAAEAVADSDDNEEIGALVYRLSRTAKARAAAVKDADATMAEHGRTSIQDWPPKGSHPDDDSMVKESGGNSGQEQCAREDTAASTKRTIPVEEGVGTVREKSVAPTKLAIPVEEGACAAPSKKRRKVCAHEGCSSNAQNRGVCYKHGALPCNFDAFRRPCFIALSQQDSADSPVRESQNRLLRV